MASKAVQTAEMLINEDINVKLAFKPLDFGCEQGAIRFKSGAYTSVREHFEPNCNAAHGQKMMV